MRGALVRIGAPQNVLDDVPYFLYKTASTKDSRGSSAGVPSMIYRFGDYEFDAQRYELRCAGQLVAIEPKVLAVLVYLLEHRDRVVTKEELLEHCWPGTFVSEAALTRCLAKVRKTVQPEPDGLPVIKTLYGRGYSFVAPATVLSREPSLPLMPAAHDATPVATGRSKILIVDYEPLNIHIQ